MASATSSSKSPKKLKSVPSTGKKNKLRTSRDVYNRLKWDAASLSIDISKVYIGYKDRFLGMCELPFTDFHPTAEDSDIPYHRIYYFRGGGPAVCPAIGKDGEVQVREHNWPPDVIFYWDRERRLDAIFNSGEGFPPPQRNTRRFNPSASTKVQELYHGCKGYDIVPSYKFNSTTDSWEVFNPESDNPNFCDIESLKIVSFNILYDLYDSELIYSGVRWPYLIDALEDFDADIIALQEVTIPFLTLLEAQPWVKADYCLTDISTSGNSTLNPYGQIILSKIPFQKVFFVDHGGKRYVIGSLELRFAGADGEYEDRLLHMANVHLKSNYRGESIKIREIQVQDLLESLNGLEIASGVPSDVLILGDTNFKAEETISGFIDAWESVNPDEDSFTIDIKNNALARRQSRSGNNERYDRIFFKPTNRFQPISIRVVGKTPIDLDKAPRANRELEVADLSIDFALNLTDHYGLECVIKPYVEISASPVENVEKDAPMPIPTYTYKSAVALVPPKEVWAPIQAIRSEFDPSFARWPPHINLVYGFIPDSGSNFAKAKKLLQECILEEKFQPFEINLNEIGVFKHGNKSMTVYLTSKNSEELTKLEELEALLRSKYPKSKGERSEFKPHLTIAKLPSQSAQEQQKCEELIQAWRTSADLTSISFKAAQIQLISRAEDKPFVIQHTIHFPLEADYLQNFLRANHLLPTRDGQALRAAASKELDTIFAQFTEKIRMQLAGSTLLDINDDFSDLDVLCCGPESFSREDFFKELEIAINPEDSKLKLKLDSIVLNALVPVARLSLDDLKIDLTYISSPHPSPWDIPEDQLRQMNDSFAQSTEGIREARIFLELIPSKCHAAYRTAVRALKYWAKRRNIYSKTLGFLGSTQIASLVAYPIIQYNVQEICAEDLVEQVFYAFSDWNWPTPVTIKDRGGEQLSQSRIPLLMPILSAAYPYSNKCRSVTPSTRALLKQEIGIGDHIFSSRCNFIQNWSILVEEVQDFFSNKLFSTYLSVSVSVSCDTNSSNTGRPKGLLESRLVSLVVGLEDSGIYVQPYTQIFEQSDDNGQTTTATAFIGLRCKREYLNLKAIEEFRTKFKAWYISTSGADESQNFALDVQVIVLNPDEVKLRVSELNR